MYINKNSVLIIVITTVVMLAILVGTALIWRHCHRSSLQAQLETQLQKYLAESLDPYDPVPLVQQPDAMTSKDYNQQQMQWFKETIPANYQRHGVHSQQWDEQVLHFLELYYSWREDMGNRERHKEFKDQGDEVVALGCTDPYIRYLHGLAIHEWDGAQAAEEIIHTSFEDLTSYRKYPIIYQYYAAKRTESIYEALGKGTWGNMNISLKKFYYLGLAAEDNDFKNGNQRYYAQMFISEWEAASSKKHLLNEFEVGFAQTKDVDPWIKLLVEGHIHIRKAWQARSGDWAYTVSKDQWEVFHDEIAQARECLTRAYALHPEYPEAATAMITVSTAESTNQRRWLDRAVAAHFDYLPAYNLYFWGIRPRWGGSHDQMRQFGIECLNTGRFDTEVPRQYLKALWDIGLELRDWREAYTSSNAQMRIRTLCEGMQKEPTRQEDPGYWTSLHGILAWAGHNYTLSHQLFEQAGDQLYEPIFASFLTTREVVLGELELLTGPHVTLYKRAEQRYHEDQSLEAIPMYQELLQSLTPGSPAQPLLQDRLDTLTRRQEYQQGQWVDLLPGSDFSGWDTQAEQWTVDANGLLGGTTTNANNRAWLMCKSLFQGDYEIQADLEGDISTSLVLGYVKWTYDAFLSINLYPKENHLTLRDRWCTQKIKINLDEPDSRNQLHIRSQSGKVTVELNGTRIVNEQEIPQHWWNPTWGQVGVAGSYKQGGQVQIHSLRIRKL